MIYIHLKCSQGAALSCHIFHLGILLVIFNDLLATKSLYDFGE